MNMWKVNLSGSLVLSCGVLFGVDLESSHLDALKVRPQGRRYIYTYTYTCTYIYTYTYTP